MKFTYGYWLNKPGVENADAGANPRSESAARHSVYLYAVPYAQDVRAMGGPCAGDDHLLPQAGHPAHPGLPLYGQRQKREPQFELDAGSLPPGWSPSLRAACPLPAGKTELRITKNPASFTYYYDGKKLTNIGDRFGHAMISTVKTPGRPLHAGADGPGHWGKKSTAWANGSPPFVKNGQVVDMWERGRRHLHRNLPIRTSPST